MCEFDSDGNIFIRGDGLHGNDGLTGNLLKSNPNDLNSIIQKLTNPIISVVKNFMSQSGYNFRNFERIDDPYVNIININYNISTKVNKNFNIDNIRNCIHSIFNIQDMPDKVNYRYKRVSNFNESIGIRSFMLETIVKYPKQDTKKFIIENLVQNYNTCHLFIVL